MSSAGWLYDGERAIRQDVHVDRSGDDLLIAFADGSSSRAPAQRLVHVESRPDADVYGRSDIPGWRLALADPASELAELLPSRHVYGRWIDRLGLPRAVLIGLLLSAGVLFAGSRFPSWAAPLVPLEWEERFGDALVGDFGGRFCNGPGGQAALNKMAARLAPDAGPLNIRVVNIDFVNAAALPGRNIVIFKELLSQADGPDEVAGILAHEIAHVEERHVTEALLRQLGIGVVVAAFGGTTGANIETFMAADYSRGAEREADAVAIRALRKAGISPYPTADFFERIASQEGDLAEAFSYLSTHPMSAERQRKFRASGEHGRSYKPSLSSDEWAALWDICRGAPTG